MEKDTVVVAIIFTGMWQPAIRLFKTMAMAEKWVKVLEDERGKKLDNYFLHTALVETYPELPISK